MIPLHIITPLLSHGSLSTALDEQVLLQIADFPPAGVVCGGIATDLGKLVVWKTKFEL